uniref:Putative secreted protein n=1 Tax=Anopheles triannulatus TaxID=58253 RepID=A0A2M4B265_9DIPT
MRFGSMYAPWLCMVMLVRCAMQSHHLHIARWPCDGGGGDDGAARDGGVHGLMGEVGCGVRRVDRYLKNQNTT